MNGKPPELGKKGWFTYKDYLSLGPVVMMFGLVGALVLPFILFSLVSKYPYMDLYRVYTFGLPSYIGGTAIGYWSTQPALNMKEWMFTGGRETIKAGKSLLLFLFLFIGSASIGIIFSYFYFRGLGVQTDLWPNPTYWGLLGIFALCGNVTGSMGSCYAVALEAKKILGGR